MSQHNGMSEQLVLLLSILHMSAKNGHQWTEPTFHEVLRALRVGPSELAQAVSMAQQNVVQRTFHENPPLSKYRCEAETVRIQQSDLQGGV